MRPLRCESLERRELFATLATLSSTDDWDVEVTDTASDAVGNSYLSGILSPRTSGVGSIPAGPIDIDPAHAYGDDRDILTTQGDKGMAFFAKYGAGGTIEWVNRIERITAGTVSRHIVIEAASANNGVYFTGIGGPGLQIGSTILSDAGPGADRFAGKFAANGALEWATTFTTGAAVEYPTRGGLAVDEARGRLYVTGTQMLTNPGRENGVVAALNISNPANVNLAWSRTIVASGTYSPSYPQAYIGSVVVDSSGNVISLVSVYGSADFDPGSGRVMLSSGSGTKLNPGVVWKLNASGNYVSALQFEPSNNSSYSVKDIAIDGLDNIYVAGNFGGTVDFQTGKSVKSLTSAGGSDVYVVKLSPANAVQFAKRHGGTNGDELAAIALDASGVYLAYKTRGVVGIVTHSTIAKFDLLATNANPTWTHTLYGATAPLAIAVNPVTGKVRLAGQFQSIDTDFDDAPDLFATQGGDAFWLDLEQS